jgi:hypothetical protein
MAWARIKFHIAAEVIHHKFHIFETRRDVATHSSKKKSLINTIIVL